MTAMQTVGENRIAVIIEDDSDIRHLLETVLQQAGFETISAANGADGVTAVQKYNPIVTTLDVSMPGMDGFETAKRIRAFSTTYLIMLTARDEEIDTLQGLESGADDYMTKPFRPRELRARVEAMLRRPRVAPVRQDALVLPPAQGSEVLALNSFVSAAPAAAAVVPVAQAVTPAIAPAAAPTAPAAPAEPSIQDAVLASAQGYWLIHNGLRLNPEARLADLDGSRCDLTRSEFDLLVALLESGRRVRSKADLALLLRGESYITSHFISEADKRAVEVHMANLRRKLSDNTNSPRFIETVRGIGYRLTAADDAYAAPAPR